MIQLKTNWSSKILLASFILFLSASSVFAFQIDLDLLKNKKARSIGPAGMSGRVTTIDVVLKNDNIWYIGSASGGLWKTDNKGMTFTPVFDDQQVLSIGAVSIFQENPSIVWAGTGEGNPRNSNNGGNGIYKSIDGGETWTHMGLDATRHIYRIVTHPTDPNTVWAAAIGSPWGKHPERGVYKTTDGGKSWKKVLYVNESTGAADLIIDPSNPNKLFAAMWEHYREPWFFTSGGEGSGLYMTIDGGDTWEKLDEDNGLPKGPLGRIGLSIVHSKPNVVYATVESKKNAFYRSEDGGKNWTKQTDKGQFGDRPFYYADIFADPINENRVYSLFSRVSRTEDGGKTWDVIIPYYGVHPDHHAFWIHPEKPNFLLDGTDGGLHVSYDGGGKWDFFENLPLGQFYHINVDNELPYNVYGGMQDNGSWKGPAYTWGRGGITNTMWEELTGGDGFDVVADPENPRYLYSMSQQGNVSRVDTETGASVFIKPTHPVDSVKLRFNWNAAIAQDPFDAATIYFGSQFVHKSTNHGFEWEIISPDLTTNNPEKQRQSESGGLTIDATGAENHTTILAIEPSSLEKDVLWVGTDDGQVQLTRDGGKSWTNLSSKIKGMPKEAWVPQIRASKHNKGEALVVVNDYRRFNYEPYVFRTTNYGKSWERIVDEDDVFGFALSIIQDPVEPNLYFLGTENGLFVSFDAAKTWQQWTHGYPKGLSTADLVIQERDKDLVIGTYGRAIYILDDIEPLRAWAKDQKIATETVYVYDAPTAYMLEGSENNYGYSWSNGHVYMGENRSSRSRISYTINKPKEGKADSVIVKIYTDSDKLIRTLRFKAPSEDGLHTFSWDLSEKGGRMIGGRGRRSGGSDPSGVSVMPGKYKIELSYAGATNSAWIQVEKDPRLPNITNDILEDRRQFMQQVIDLMDGAAPATDRLAGMQKTAKNVSDWIKDSDHPQADSLMKITKAIQKDLSEINAFWFGEEDSRQGIVRSTDPTVQSRVYDLYRYGETWQKAGDLQYSLLDRAKTFVNEGVTMIETFETDKWETFKTQIKEAELSPFKETSEEE